MIRCIELVVVIVETVKTGVVVFFGFCGWGGTGFVDQFEC